jgi:BASS family bile acid:Na+ symporter
MRVAGVLLTLGALAFIFSSWREIAEIGLPSLLAFASFTGLALTIGHWLGGPDEGHRSSLAVSCATRHIGLALLIAANVRGPRTLALVAAYLFASALVCIPYIRWRRRALNRAIAEGAVQQSGWAHSATGNGSTVPLGFSAGQPTTLIN